MGGAISSLFGGGGSNAGSAAAGAANQFTQQGIDEMRRQFDVTREDLAPFIEAGVGVLPSLVGGSTVGGLDARLSEILGTDAFQGLVGERERAVQGQLAAGGLTRSGAAIEAAAAVPTDLALQLENLLTGRGQSLAGMGQSSTMGQAELGTTTSSNIANLFSQQGQNISSGILADQQAEAAQQAQQMQMITTAASIFFSDPALKENIEQISHIGDLPLYEWDWIAETSGTMVEKCGTIGFMADEVKEKYPQHVCEFGGFMVIDYASLLDEMEATQCQH